MSDAVVILGRARLSAAQWWSLRSGREQALLAGLAAVTVFAILLFLIWGPILRSREASLQEIRTWRALAAQVRVAGPALATQAAGPTGSTAGVAASAAEFGLVISRLEPQGQRTRVVLQDAPFERVLRWMERLDRDGLSVSSVRLERRATPGMVGAQLTLET